MRFEGFPERALIFYEGLEADNSKSYWTDNKPVYEECVRAPLAALLAELEPEFGAGKIFRPYRDVRFSKDKTLYKTNAAATTSAIWPDAVSTAPARAAGAPDCTRNPLIGRLLPG